MKLRHTAPLQQRRIAITRKAAGLDSGLRRAAKTARDAAIRALYDAGMTQVQIVSMNVGDVYADLSTITPRRVRSKAKTVVEINAVQAGRLAAWMTYRRLIGPDDDALFISLHWTDAVARPCSRISTRGCFDVVVAASKTTVAG